MHGTRVWKQNQKKKQKYEVKKNTERNSFITKLILHTQDKFYWTTMFFQLVNTHTTTQVVSRVCANHVMLYSLNAGAFTSQYASLLSVSYRHFSVCKNRTKTNLFPNFTIQTHKTKIILMKKSKPNCLII